MAIFIIKKEVEAKSIKEAFLKDKESEVIEIFKDRESQNTNQSVLGFKDK